MTYNDIYSSLSKIYASYEGTDYRYDESVGDLELEDEFHNFLLDCKNNGDILDFSIENVHNFESCGYDTGVVSVAAIYKDNKLIHDVFEWERC